MLTKTSQLEAINTMLSTIGEPPVNSLSSQRADSLIAVQILNEVSREVQSYGWHFNIEYKVRMTPDSSGFLYVSENVARVDTDLIEGRRSGDRIKDVQDFLVHRTSISLAGLSLQAFRKLSC
jgi:hypothetical protein